MKKKKSGKRIFAIVLLVVIGIGGFYFGYVWMMRRTAWRIWKNIMNSCRRSMERHRIQKPLF